MKDLVCLRCDWHGARAVGCPRCGEPLYRWRNASEAFPPRSGPGVQARPPVGTRASVRVPPVRAEARRARPAGARVPPDPAVEPDPTGGRVRGVMSSLAVVVVVIAIAGWFAARTGDRTAGGPRLPPELTGTLIYAVDRGDGTSRLWRWDLETGELRRGPDVASVLQLVDAYAANPGWVGVTSRSPAGDLTAAVLRFLEPGDAPVTLLRGDRVAWDGRGMTVVALREGAASAGCRRDVSIDLVSLATSERHRQYERDRLCGRITTLGRGSQVTFFTLRRSGRTHVYFAGVQAHRILRDHTMLSVSPTNGLLVVPTPRRSDTYDGADVQGGDVSLFSRGLGEAGPIAYGTRGRPFVLDRVLAWTTDSLSAIVVGRWGTLSGLFLLDGGAGDGLEPPSFLGPSSGIAHAAFSHRDEGFVADGGALSYVRDGALVPLPLPSDAAVPDGPIVWIP